MPGSAGSATGARGASPAGAIGVGNRPRGVAAPRRNRLRDRLCRIVEALEVEPCLCPLVPIREGCTLHEWKSSLGEGTEEQRAWWDARRRGEAENAMPVHAPKARAAIDAAGVPPQLEPKGFDPEYRLKGMVVGTEHCVHTQRCHVLPVGDWLALLRLWDAEGYRERPLGVPRRVATRAGRVALYRLRVSRGEAVFHPLDLCLAKEEGIEVLGAKGKAEVAGEGGVVQR
jgi:hypothetical protein